MPTPNIIAYLVLALPNVLLTSAIFFAVATLTRSMMYSYVGVVVFLVLYLVLNGFLRTKPELAVPDIEFMFRGLPGDAGIWFPGVKKPYADGFGIRPCLLHPESRGEVLLNSADPLAPPRIVYNFFSQPNDLPRLREGFKLAREVANQKALDPYRGEETKATANARTDEEIEAYLRRAAITAHHPAGTCKMGTDSQAVLDPQLRVRGVENLRVVDASAMPDMVGAHINACVIMMADKASDMIRGREALVV